MCSMLFLMQKQNQEEIMKTQTLLHKSARFIAVVMSIMVMAAMMPMLYTDSAVYAEDTAVTASQETAFTT